MQSRQKALLPLGKRTMVERVIARLRPQCTELLLNVPEDADQLSFAGLPVIPDALPGSVGPLAGLCAALDWVAANRPDIKWLASSPTDAPFLPRDLVARLHHARSSDSAILCCAQSGDHVHSLHALWPVHLREDLRHALVAESVRKVSSWTARYHVAHAYWSCDPFDPFFNINTPEDLQHAETLVELNEEP